MTRDVSSSADVIDIRDLIERFEELEAKEQAVSTAREELEEGQKESEELTEAEEDFDEDERAELAAIRSLLDELEGNGGDHDWRGSWYPLMLIRDDNFEDFARQEAEDLGLINDDAKWPATCIDWEQAANELQTDYSSAEYDGVTYWYR